MDAVAIVLVVIAALVILAIVVIIGFALYVRGAVRRGLAKQQTQSAKFPEWGAARGLTYDRSSDDVPVEDLAEHAPFRNFTTPGAFVAADHVFSRRVDGRRSLVLQLTVYADPRPGATPDGGVTIAATELPNPTTESEITGSGRKIPHIHTRGQWVTCYLGGPLTLERATIVHDHLAAHLDPAGAA
jgi:hypothetical protein